MKFLFFFPVRYFENELWYIEHIIVSLQDVMEHVFICQEIFVAEEVRTLFALGRGEMHTGYS